ncbi:MAG: DUF2723 domain-containing protein [Rikenellaceae bacterium]|jgi:hypothetical protein|nr:DUF2723 domain-containing protein [Rikenellaceae bacterium]
MQYFKKNNNIVGWAVFAVALGAYVLTTEPAGSWWDCMEFIATSYKLEIGHPPGAPLFMMIMRLFTMLSFGDVYAVGLAANLMSCTASAFCILFMFWTITLLARKMYGRGGRDFDGSNKTQVRTVLGAGIIGSLAYTFSDTFWFSAVEGEVYALSSMFTALVVWLMLRWEEVADEPHANRWLVLIAYMMGLSIGVHILNLLTLPALVFIYYFRKTPKITAKGVVVALLASGGILLVIYKIIMSMTVSIGAWFDRVFVNTLGLPVNSGMVFWVLLLFALVGTGVWLTHIRGKVVWNTVLLCVGVILIGYTSYASVIIRSSVNPPMDSNDPSNPYALLSLLSRTQYESQPIVVGPAYSSVSVDTEYSTTYFLNTEGKYEKRQTVAGYKYPASMEFLFPRMWNYASADAYKAWVDVKGRKARIGDQTVTVPTFGENLQYFFGYQLNYMYWRYFMWNFVGRQDDIQGTGDILHGNWLSGITPIDELYLGPQTDLPEEVANNRARNKFYFLPFLLGVLGLIYQLSKDKRGFAIVMWLFVMMGVALVVYFNLLPTAPRERDYIYAGSFYAFAIWIGFGVMWVQEWASRLFKRQCWVSAVVATAVCAVVPALLAAQGWDDHNRSRRYIAHDIGYDDLSSTLPGSIIMNYGDNDTFPLWYNQEVEEYRTDVRIMNMSYIGADWYIDQMRLPYNESAPVPLTIPAEVYRANDYVYVREVLDRPMTAQWIVEFVKSRDPRTQIEGDDGKLYDYLPTRRVLLPVNKENAVASGIVRAEDAHLMVDTIEFTLPESMIDKTQLVLLDLLANFDWARPLSFTTHKQLRDIGLADWLQSDGYVYRFVPIRTPFDVLDAGRIDSDYSYNLLMNEYKYGNARDPRVYVDYNSVVSLRFVQVYNVFARLAKQLAEEGDKARAVEVLDRVMTEYPHGQLDYDFWSTYAVIEAYYVAGAVDKGDALLEDYANTLQEYIEYYLQFEGAKGAMVENVMYDRYRDLDSVAKLANYYGRSEQHAAISSYLQLFVK